LGLAYAGFFAGWMPFLSPSPYHQSTEAIAASQSIEVINLKLLK